MEDISKKFTEEVSRLEKEGTPIRSFATCARLFVEAAYKRAVALGRGGSVQGLYAEKRHLAAHSLVVFQQNNKVSGGERGGGVCECVSV
jgi:hypothetical protein